MKIAQSKDNTRFYTAFFLIFLTGRDLILEWNVTRGGENLQNSITNFPRNWQMEEEEEEEERISNAFQIRWRVMLAGWLGENRISRPEHELSYFFPPSLPPFLNTTWRASKRARGGEEGDASRGVTGRPKRISWPELCFDVFWQTGAIIPAPSLKALWVLAGQPSDLGGRVRANQPTVWRTILRNNYTTGSLYFEAAPNVNFPTSHPSLTSISFLFIRRCSCNLDRHCTRYISRTRVSFHLNSKPFDSEVGWNVIIIDC